MDIMTPKLLDEKVFATARSVDRTVRTLLMNVNEYAQIRKFGRDELDIETNPHLLKTGVQGYIHGAKIVTSKSVSGHVFAQDENECVICLMCVRTGNVHVGGVCPDLLCVVAEVHNS